MRTPFVVMLMILTIPLMGSDCAVAARVGGPPPQGGTNPPPNNGGGGVIIIASGNSSASGANAEAVRIDRELVTSMLAVSVWTPPDPERVAAASTADAPTSILSREEIEPVLRETGFVLPVGIAREAASLAVPEPTGFVLFAAGLWVASRAARARKSID